ncbi:3-oxoacyl-ACP synthase III family protein [Marinifilum flexuosum]|uniref:3-oxoacyl-[acyl-carrier-protein] synthase-3 n=1 Tax=Marinifilum flexuosum TaxID=1117708 RepID=A0A419XA06_9BACT|nr:ketoacyl-ACP synthase III [Marinifilum flexuosum]RKE04594.1 3-oxoacyl-[acyl-carrier-protein] synthase-3 [Marinifilum flexuosum]
MAVLEFENIGISAMSGAVPKTVINNYEYTKHFPVEQVKEVVDKIGIYERRFVDSSTCASDLCFAAAEKLIEDNQIDKNEIDLIVFISQTPDYRMPATSLLLQDRLGLSNKTIAFDINLGCSAFIYGLSVVYGFMQNKNIRKALILDGETRSKVYSPKDRQSAFIFGDAGVVALIERNEKFGKSYFSLNSDGSRSDLIMIKGGGYRCPSSLETLEEKVVDEYGNIRSDEHGYMKGGDVFNFVIREVPKDLKFLMKYAEMDKDEFDYYVFHQANNFINSYIAKKLKLDSTKIPATIHKYGNTSSVSVPLTIISELKEQFTTPKKVLLSAFGVGMTWATGVINLDNCAISEIVEI